MKKFIYLFNLVLSLVLSDPLTLTFEKSSEQKVILTEKPLNSYPKWHVGSGLIDKHLLGQLELTSTKDLAKLILFNKDGYTGQPNCDTTNKLSALKMHMLSHGHLGTYNFCVASNPVVEHINHDSLRGIFYISNSIMDRIFQYRENPRELSPIVKYMNECKYSSIDFKVPQGDCSLEQYVDYVLLYSVFNYGTIINYELAEKNRVKYTVHVSEMSSSAVQLGGKELFKQIGCAYSQREKTARPTNHVAFIITVNNGQITPITLYPIIYEK